MKGATGLKAIDRKAVRKLPLFDGLDEGIADDLLVKANIQRVAAGKLLFTEGSVPSHLYALLSGTAELFTAHSPRESGILLMSVGDMFMPAAVLFDEPYLNSARALTRSKILLLDAEAVRSAFGRSHEVAVRMSRVLAGHFRMSVRHLIDLKTRTAAQRLAAFLLRLVDGCGSGSVELPVPKRSLASRVGMTAETFSRTLQTLAEHGLVVRGTRVILRDRAAIDRFCGPAPYSDPTEIGLNVHAL